MILSGKRLASSPAEAEKKKTDFKTSSTTECPGSYRDAASRGYLPPTNVIDDWDGGDSILGSCRAQVSLGEEGGPRVAHRVVPR